MTRYVLRGFCESGSHPYCKVTLALSLLEFINLEECSESFVLCTGTVL